MRFKNGLILSLILLNACATFNDNERAAIASRQTTVHASAPIADGGVVRARQAAIENAVAIISEQLRPDRATSFAASDVKVVDEWQDSGVYHVQVLAVKSNKNGTCQAHYRKRLVATAFPAMSTEQISGSDSQDLYSGIPREIGNRLMESGDYIVRNRSNTLLYDRPDLAPEIPRAGRYADTVLTIVANQNNAELVLSGVIRDFKIEATEYVRGTGVLAYLKSMARDYVARRSIAIDVYVYDGFTGALVFQQRYSDTVLGDVSLPAGYSVGSERFDSNPAGHKITQIIEMAANDIRKQFACYPFSARVERVENQRIIFAAGAQDGIRTGDRLMVYSASNTGTLGLGFTDPIGVMQVTDVGPSMSAGRLEDEVAKTIIRPGDWVRSFSTP